MLLLLLLPFMCRLALDPEVTGEHALGMTGRLLTGLTIAVIAVSVGALAVLTVL